MIERLEEATDRANETTRKLHKNLKTQVQQGEQTSKCRLDTLCVDNTILDIVLVLVFIFLALVVVYVWRH